MKKIAIILTLILISVVVQAQITWTYSSGSTDLQSRPGDSSGISSSVTSQEVQESGLTSLEVSRSIPSLQIQGSELASTPGTVFLRGSPSDEVLVLWNGIELNDPSTSGGGANPMDFQKEFSHQLQVLKGPQNLLLGPRALAGVLDWKKSSAVSSRAQVSAGSLQNQKGLLEIQQPWGQGRWGLGLTQFRGQGLSASSAPGIQEKDAQARGTGSVFFENQLGEFASLEFVGFLSEVQSEDDLFGQQDTDAHSSVRQQGGRLSYKQKLRTQDRLQLDWQSIRSQRENRNDPVTDMLGYLDKSSGERSKIAANWEHDLSAGLLIFHIDTVFETMMNESEGSWPKQTFDQNQSMQGLAVVSEWPEWKSRFGVRHDQYVPQSEHIQRTWSGQYLQRGPVFADDMEPYFNIAQGHRFPTLYQRFSSFGDPELHSQTLRSYELGLTSTKKAGGYSVSIFRNDYTQMIDYDLIAQKFQNRGETQILGLENELHFQDLLNSYRMGFTVLQAQDLSTHQDLARRPRWAGTLVWVHQYSDFLSTTADLHWLGERPDRDLSGSVVLPASLLGQIVIQYRSRSAWLYKLSLENIFNSGSPEIATYTVVPKSFIFTLEYSL